MDREQVIATLRAHEPELKAAGIVSLSVFGSVARDDADSASDVDLIAEFDKTKRLSLLDVVGLELQLTDLLGVSVDLVQQGTLKRRVQESVDGEAILAF